jgi:hypothetical protein
MVTTTKAGTPTGEWGRRRLVLILLAAGTVAALLAGGLVYAIALAIGGVTATAPEPDEPQIGIDTGVGRQTAHGAAHRDQVAAAPMLAVPDDAMLPGPTSDTDPLEPLLIPTGSVTGPGQILTGFPHTPEGAIGQLAQIDLAVLQAMSTVTANEVYRAWALPGGIGPDRWAINRSVQAFLASTAMGEVVDPGAGIEVEPAAALVKGTDGPDWLVGCVLLKVTAIYRQEAQAAYAHCERLQWVGGRWMIAAGLPPTEAPSTWPGTELAARAGWRPWITVQTGTGAGTEAGS